MREDKLRKNNLVVQISKTFLWGGGATLLNIFVLNGIFKNQDLNTWKKFL